MKNPLASVLMLAGGLNKESYALFKSLTVIGLFLCLVQPANATTVSFNNTYYGPDGKISVVFEGTDVDGDGFVTRNPFASSSNPDLDIITKVEFSGTIYDVIHSCEGSTLSSCTIFDINRSFSESSFLEGSVKTDLSKILLFASTGPETIRLYVDGQSVSGFFESISPRGVSRHVNVNVDSNISAAPLPASGFFLLAGLLLLSGWKRLKSHVSKNGSSSLEFSLRT